MIITATPGGNSGHIELYPFYCELSISDSHPSTCFSSFLEASDTIIDMAQLAFTPEQQARLQVRRESDLGPLYGSFGIIHCVLTGGPYSG